MKSIIKSVIALSGMVVVLSGCLKDKEYEKGKSQSLFGKKMPDVIELGVTATSASNFLTVVYENGNHDTTFSIPVNLASALPATEDIQVTVAPDPALVTAYNTANGTSFGTPGATMYSIENAGNVVTIPKGSYTGYFRVKLKPSVFLGADWAFGFRIMSIKQTGYTMSGNLKTVIVQIAIKNQYDGNYKSAGFFQHPTSPRAIDRTKYAATVSANTVVLELGDLGGATQIYLTINANNSVTITPGPGANTATAAISGDAVYNNTYDPVTRVFKLKYGYPNPTGPRIVTETLTRQ